MRHCRIKGRITRCPFQGVQETGVCGKSSSPERTWPLAVYSVRSWHYLRCFADSIVCAKKGGV